MILQFLGIRGIVAAVAIAGLLAQSGCYRSAVKAQRNPETQRLWKDEAKEAKAALSVAQRDLGTCRVNTGTLQGALDRQGASLRALGEESRAKTAAAEKAASEARKSARDLEARARAVLAAKPGADRCVSALAILRGEAG